MADIKQCDGCGSQSPDERGFHVANNWIEIAIQHNLEKNIYTDTCKRFVLCPGCFKEVNVPRIQDQFKHVKIPHTSQ